MKKIWLESLMNREDLSPEAMTEAIEILVQGEADPIQVGAFLAALRTKGESPSEIAAAAKVLRSKALPVSLGELSLVDTCGTGGDGLDTPNVSTLVALLLPHFGLKVAKHGNRSISSKCGSADLLEGLGIELSPPPEAHAACLDEAGICFLFAPTYHPSMAAVGPIRRALGVRTMFNLLGPLANPTAPSAQVLGVFDPGLTRCMAETLAQLGVDDALVVHGMDGMDEITTFAKTRGHRLSGGEVTPFEVDPRALGIPEPSPEDLAGGDLEKNRALAQDLLEGTANSALNHLVALNAGAMLWITGQSESLKAGHALALEAATKGAAGKTLESWQKTLGRFSS